MHGNRSHGLTGTPEHRAWVAMRHRCRNPANDSYADYGGRGIQVCPRWDDCFEAFLHDMGPRPSDEHSIERKDVHGHYEPDNCIWATWVDQNNNRRTSLGVREKSEEVKPLHPSTHPRAFQMFKTPSRTLVGKVFGLLTVEAYEGSDARKNSLWRCRCSCGGVTTASATGLRAGNPKSCGCLAGRGAKRSVEVGMIFGRLEVLSDTGRKYRGNRIWLCKCECGTAGWEVPHNSLQSGNTRSCGCLSRDVSTSRNSTHGASRTVEYRAWKKIKERCFNPNVKQYKDYGGRGISMSPLWINDFPAFLAEVGGRPSALHSVEREKVDLGYVPGNVVWATRSVQARNTRRNVMLTHEGRTMCLQDWADELGLNRSVVKMRVRRGWTIRQSLNLDPK